jgi:Flp pilus assembly protein TadG
MMTARRSWGARRGRRGIAAVETALVLPLLLTLLLGLWEVGRILEVQQVLCIAARDAARQAGSGLCTNAQVKQTAINSVRRILDDASGDLTKNLAVDVAVYSKDAPTVAEPIDVSLAEPLDLLKVTITIPYADVRWIQLPMVTGAVQLRAETTWLSLKNLPYPTAVPQPPQG